MTCTLTDDQRRAAVKLILGALSDRLDDTRVEIAALTTPTADPLAQPAASDVADPPSPASARPSRRCTGSAGRTTTRRGTTVPEPTFGERLARTRKERGLRQNDLAKQVGVELRTYQRWEADEREPYPVNLLRLAEVLNVAVRDLTGEPEPHQLDRIERLVRDLIDRVDRIERRIGGEA
jgi:transcriptional regulator with XRE-family HTH domain